MSRKVKPAASTVPRERVTSATKLLLGVAIVLAVLTAAMFYFGKSGAPRNVAFVALGTLLSTFVALAVQFPSDRIFAEQLTRLHAILASLSGVEGKIGELGTAAAEVQGAVSSVSGQIQSASDALDELQRTASSAREDVLRLKLSGPEPVAGINLPETHLDGLKLPAGRDLTEALLEGVSWSRVEAEDAIFADARLQGASISGTMNRASFAGAYLQDCTLVGNFGGCIFDRAFLTGTRVRGYFRRSDFRHARDFTGVHASAADLRDCCFGEIDYTQQSCFWTATLSGSEFVHTCIGGCDFRWSVLRHVRIAAEDGMSVGTLFDGALLEGTDFRETSVQTLGTWDLRGAIDAGAFWPDGFNAKDAGVLPTGSSAGVSKLRELFEVREVRSKCPDHDEGLPSTLLVPEGRSR